MGRCCTVCLICLYSLLFAGDLCAKIDDQTIIVYYGGNFTREQASLLAETASWLKGIDHAGRLLSQNVTIRMSGLDLFEAKSLAAFLNLVEARINLLEAPIGDHAFSGEFFDSGQAIGQVDVHLPNPIELSANLPKIAERNRWEELIHDLESLSVEALDLAAQEHKVREQVASGSVIAANADVSITGRLGWLMEQMLAYAIYMDILRNYPADQQGSLQQLGMLEKALSHYPRSVPLNLAKAETLLYLDRPASAMRALSEISELLLARQHFISEGSSADTPAKRITRRRQVSLFYMRALAELGSGQPTLAEQDLDKALVLAPENPNLWLARGASRQINQQYDLMCQDYLQACALGECSGIMAARAQARCIGQSDK